MPNVAPDVDRVLTHLGNKIRQLGWNQLRIQEQLGWGKSYISQLMIKQKKLRVEQVLLILEVIGGEPGDFFAELFPLGGQAAGPPRPGADGPPAMSAEEADALHGRAEEFSTMLSALVEVLVAEGVLSEAEAAGLRGSDTG